MVLDGVGGWYTKKDLGPWVQLKKSGESICCFFKSTIPTGKILSRFVRPVRDALITVHGSVSHSRKTLYANLLPLNENIATSSKHFMSCSHLLSQVEFGKENARAC